MQALRRNIVLFGCPGAGKGAQAQLLSLHGGIPHVSTGELLRDEIARQTDTGRRLETTLARGGFADDDTVLGMIRSLLDRPDFEAGFIMDGFPRTIAQAQTFDDLLATRRRRVDHAIYIRAAEEVVIDRLSGRRVCSNCRANYHVQYRPSSAGSLCDSCGAGLIRRPEDHASAQLERFRAYQRQTAPLVEYYRSKGVLSEVEGEASIEVVADRIQDVLRPVGPARN